MVTKLIKLGSFGTEIVEFEKRESNVYFRTGFNSVKNKSFKKTKFKTITDFKKELGNQFMTVSQAKTKKLKDNKESKRITKVFESRKSLIDKQQAIFLKAKMKYNTPRVVEWENPEKSNWLKIDKKIRSLN